MVVPRFNPDYAHMPTGDDVESITSPEVAEKLTKKAAASIF